jgi:xylan 1,4-beta-xylosidase
MSVDEVVDGYSYWTFSDIFEENYFPSVPFHGGFGMMNLYGIPKPIYRAFQMLRSLGNRRFEVRGEHATVAAWVGRESIHADNEATAILINQAMPRHPLSSEAITLELANGPTRQVKAVSVTRVDATHANPEQAWKDMGSPEYLKPDQVQRLLLASQTEPEPLAWRVGESGLLAIDIVLATQSVNLIRVEWEPAP